MTTTWVCRTCARPTEHAPEDGGCVCVGTDARPSKPVAVPDDALQRAAAGPQSAQELAGFARRRGVMPVARPFGTSAAERAHQLGQCDSRTCVRCALVAEMRTTADDSTTTRRGTG